MQALFILVGAPKVPPDNAVLLACKKNCESKRAIRR